MIRIIELINSACSQKASDIHIHEHETPSMRIRSVIYQLDDKEVSTTDIDEFITFVNPSQKKLREFELNGAMDIGITIEDVGNFRVNIYKEQNLRGIAIRHLPSKIPDFESLGMYPPLKKIADIRSGLVLVTGLTGNGKSTTIASIINYINMNQSKHIITIEDPIEYRYPKGKSVMTQREIGRDCETFQQGLVSALRQDPDIIIIGEMRDEETVKVALDAAESGHLVLSTLHTCSAAATVDRIISFFNGGNQAYLRSKLANVLSVIVSQKLMLSKDGTKMHAAQEVVFMIDSIRALIRDGKTYQINSFIQINRGADMISLEEAIAKLVLEDKVSLELATQYANDPKLLNNFINQMQLQQKRVR